MYAIETAKMSSRGQLVVPESFRAASVKARFRDAKRALDRLSSLAITIPIDAERGDRRRALAERRHA